MGSAASCGASTAKPPATGDEKPTKGEAKEAAPPYVAPVKKEDGSYERFNTLLPSDPKAKYKLAVVQFKVCAGLLTDARPS